MSEAVFRCGHLERLPLGTPYPGVVAHVGRLLSRLPPRTELVIDYTGVGRPVFEMFLGAGLSPTGLLITGGVAESYEGAIVSVPKLVLISRVQALLHEGRLKIHKDLAAAAELVRELQDFRVEFTAAGSITFNARTGRHDDLVLALAIAVWCAYGGGGQAAGWLDYYRQETAKIRQAPEPMKTVMGVDLGQARDPTAIAVIQRVPAALIAPATEALYAPGSVERAEQDARGPAAPVEEWMPQ